MLARHADQATLALFDRELDGAYVEALGSGSPEPMRAVVGRWWTVAQMAEHGPAADRRFVSREQFAAQWERRNGRPFPGA
ncbi:hypothetical protein KGA66_25685 [Actinocrinis puniceicyclus]|uniref:Uncharacterized protein n=1 Tax=Actinocrinis puniceicyclus TaxID=977794 RepID=A0A8J8BH58_9ACTN|nr:hypothetical protein [Actinocrinis puniceicyclus]